MAFACWWGWLFRFALLSSPFQLNIYHSVLSLCNIQYSVLLLLYSILSQPHYRGSHNLLSFSSSLVSLKQGRSEHGEYSSDDERKCVLSSRSAYHHSTSALILCAGMHCPPTRTSTRHLRIYSSVYNIGPSSPESTELPRYLAAVLHKVQDCPVLHPSKFYMSRYTITNNTIQYIAIHTSRVQHTTPPKNLPQIFIFHAYSHQQAPSQERPPQTLHRLRLKSVDSDEVESHCGAS